MLEDDTTLQELVLTVHHCYVQTFGSNNVTLHYPKPRGARRSILLLRPCSVNAVSYSIQPQRLHERPFALFRRHAGCVLLAPTRAA